MLRRLVETTAPGHHDCSIQFRNEKLVIMALYRSPLTVTLWPSSFLKKYGPMIPPAHKAHQTRVRKKKLNPQDALHLLQNLPFESKDALTDDSSDEEVLGNNLLQFSLHS
ncbi:hypothetical protein TNCV_2080541 [Trichonephila clavipes]|nr:hypothetical protein TNCV_2080541 [Trichonephila clavipes]